MWLLGFIGWFLYVGFVVHKWNQTPPVTRLERNLLGLASFSALTFALAVARFGDFGFLIGRVSFIDKIIDWSPWLWVAGLPFYVIYGILVDNHLVPKEWLTPQEAARLVKIRTRFVLAPQQILELALEGRLAARASGSHVFVSGTSLEKYLSVLESPR